MQANELTLSVDPANDSNPENRVYSRHEETVNRSTYRASTHSLAARNLLQFYRSAPTKVGNFAGTAKSSFKVTIDRSVAAVDGGTIIVPQIVEVSFSNPVGVTSAHTQELRQLALAILDDDSVSGNLNDLLEI